MPILDGYGATQIIRTRESLRDIPVIAMTASAIQGDKEKCQEAGMDDYLAKPVRGNILERMLLKWSAEGRRKVQKMDSHESFTSKCNPSPNSSAQNTVGLPQAAGVLPPNAALPSSKEDDMSSSNLNTPTGDSPPDMTFYQKASLQIATESDDTRQQRHLENEEKASSSRDDKILSMTDDPRASTGHVAKGKMAEQRAEDGPSHPLTPGNLNRHLSGHLGEEAMVKRKDNEDGEKAG